MIASHAKWQNGNRERTPFPVDVHFDRRRLQSVPAHFTANAIDANRLGDVLEASLAEIVEDERRVAANMIEQHSAHPNRVRLGSLLYTRGEIDTISDQIIAADHHICEVYAKPH